MLQTKKLLALAVVLAALISVATIAYENYIQDEIYQESADHLLETYGQVAKTFTLFAQRNWNVLADWDSELQSIAEEKDVAALWQELVERKNSWQYSDFYMFNEDCQFLTASGRQGTQDNIRSAFLKMYEKKEPCVSAYIASSDQRKIVFAIPLSEAFTLDGVTYTGVAVSYDNEVVERLLGEVIFDGESDCYITRVDGSILLSLEPETEFSEGMEDLFGFLEAKTMMPQEDQSRVQQDIAETKSGSAMCIYRGSKYYLVYEPVGIKDWSIVGAVNSAVVDSGMEKVKRVTILVLVILFSMLLVTTITILIISMRARLDRERQARQQVEDKKKLAEQLFQGMTRIVDRFAVGDLSKDRYEYHENQFDGPIYPETGRYQDLLDGITKHYRLLGNAEDVHAGRLLTPEYLRSVLKTEQDSMKFEYCDQDQNIYKVMHVIPMEWDAEGALTKVMMIAQDIGERVALETMANTDGLTGLFNGRHFGTVLQEKEKKKFPFVLFYLDLDRFKPINDTYGHDMGDKLLKEVAARLQRCIRSKDHAFRIGGDEFALLIGADLDEAHCQQLRQDPARAVTAVLSGGTGAARGRQLRLRRLPKGQQPGHGGPHPGRPTHVRPKRGTPWRRSGQRPGQALRDRDRETDQTNTICTRNMYSTVPPAMLRRMLCLHLCSTPTTTMAMASGRPCQPVKTASFRQNTTSRPMTALGSTAPR